jgi:hypothetical protein
MLCLQGQRLDAAVQAGEAAELLPVRCSADVASNHSSHAEPLCRGHEGKGSVLALLKVKGWAQELSAGFSYGN